MMNDHSGLAQNRDRETFLRFEIKSEAHDDMKEGSDVVLLIGNNG